MASSTLPLETPQLLHLDPAHLIEISDPDEEIFSLYSRLAGASSDPPQYPPGSGKQKHKSPARGRALGLIDSGSSTISIQLGITEPQYDLSGSTVPREKRKSKSKSTTAPKVKTIEAELHQDLFAAQNRSGDTGSMVWRASVDLAEMLWYDLIYPIKTAEGLVNSLLDMNLFTNSTKILELGAGTGSLAILCDSMFPPTSTSSWTLSDQFCLLPIISRNLTHNQITHSNTTRTPSRRTIEEIDWCEIEQQWIKAHSGIHNTNRTSSSQSGYDLVIVVDCLYNESLILPLLRTIDQLADPKGSGRSSATLVLVVSELRSDEVVRAFVEYWLQLPMWKLYRVDLVSLRAHVDINLARPYYAVWCGWKSDS